MLIRFLVTCGTASTLALSGCNDDGTSTAPADGTEPDTTTETDAPADTGSAAQESFTGYQGFEELYVMTNNDDPVEICRVRYELHAVGEPSVPCVDCEWDVLVEKRNPSTVLDENGTTCASSELDLDAATLEAEMGERLAYGYVFEYQGHTNMLVLLNEETGAWEALSTANWNEETHELFYDDRNGFCSYGDGETGICGISGEATAGD